MTNVGTILQQKYAFYSKIRGYYSVSMVRYCWNISIEMGNNQILKFLNIKICQKRFYYSISRIISTLNDVKETYNLM